MKITFKETPDQIELIRAMGSRDTKVSREAMEAFAAFIGPVINQIISNAGTASLIYRDNPYNEDDSPSIPLDLFYDELVGYVTTWSQAIAGGLPTSQVESIKEMKVATYRLDSAVSFLKKYARKCRLDVVAKAVEKMSQEVLIKQERNAWAVIFKALAEATTQSLKHVIAAGAQNTFKVDDINRLMTRCRRINSSWIGGTPDATESRGLTDIFVSPEVKEQIRAFAYNPLNTKAADGSAATSSSDSIPLPDAMRTAIYQNAGLSEIYGVTVHELLELGTNRRYNLLFNEFAGTNTFGPTGSIAFDPTNDELIVGFDLGRESFIRPIARGADNGATFTAVADDQWVTRSDKAGFYGALEEGRVCIDARGVVGITL